MNNMIAIASNLKGRLIIIDPLKKKQQTNHKEKSPNPEKTNKIPYLES